MRKKAMERRKDGVESVYGPGTFDPFPRFVAIAGRNLWAVLSLSIFHDYPLHPLFSSLISLHPLFKSLISIEY
jgi:hypothetical protein